MPARHSSLLDAALSMCYAHGHPTSAGLPPRPAWHSVTILTNTHAHLLSRCFPAPWWCEYSGAVPCTLVVRVLCSLTRLLQLRRINMDTFLCASASYLNVRQYWLYLILDRVHNQILVFFEVANIALNICILGIGANLRVPEVGLVGLGAPSHPPWTPSNAFWYVSYGKVPWPPWPICHHGPCANLRYTVV